MYVTVRYEFGGEEGVEVHIDHDMDAWSTDVVDDMLSRAALAAADTYNRICCVSKVHMQQVETTEP